MKCIRCKETYDDDFRFCPYCGEKKPEPKICPYCKLEPNVEFSFCPECGTELVSKYYWEELNKLKEEIREYSNKRYKEYNNYEEVKECYVKLIELEPTDYYLWQETAELLDQLERFEEAKECYAKALKYIERDVEIDSNHYDYRRDFYWMEKGLLLEKLERYEEAIEWYDKAYESWPMMALIYKENLLNKLGRKEEAENVRKNRIMGRKII